MIKIAVVGLGHIAPYHIKAIEEDSRLCVVAVCDLRSEAVQAFHTRYPCYKNYEVAIKDTDPDVVIVATANSTHEEIAFQILCMGVHVIVEKPTSNSVQGLKRLQEQSERNGLIIYHALHSAFAREVRFFHEMFRGVESEKKYGPITGFSCNFYDPYIIDDRLQEGAVSLQNPWFDSGINALSVIERFIDGQSLKVITRTATTPNLQSTCYLSFGTSATDQSGFGAIDTNWTLGRNHKVTRLFFATSGYQVVLDHSAQTVVEIDKFSDPTLIADFGSSGHRLLNHYRGLFDDFHRKFTTDSDNYDIALQLHKLLYAAPIR